MSLSNVSLDLPVDFSGVVRLFPLPNLVLFPGVIQPLHVFEPRYLKLMDDALADNRLITMALLRSNWETTLSARPPIYPTVCIGKIISHSRLDDGRFNLLLIGAKRARVMREMSADRPYRMAEVRVLDEPRSSQPALPMDQLRRRIVSRFRRLAARQKQMDGQSLELLLDAEMPMPALLDLIAFSTGARPKLLQSVLEATQLEQRARLVLGLVSALLAEGGPALTSSGPDPIFPPDFSSN